jgi:hypothetical protein
MLTHTLEKATARISNMQEDVYKQLIEKNKYKNKNKNKNKN